MKKNKIAATIIVVITVIAIAGGAVAAALIHKVWADPTLFRGHIEQPSGDTRLVLSVNGTEIEGGTDLTTGNVVFPVLTGDVTATSAGHWTDEDGREAVAAPTMMLSTSDGNSLDGIYYQIQIHAGPVAHVAQDIADAMRFGIDVTHLEDGIPTYGTASVLDVTDTGDGYMSSRWIALGDLPVGGDIKFDFSAWATQPAEGDFFVEIVFATGEHVNG